MVEGRALDNVVFHADEVQIHPRRVVVEGSQSSNATSCRVHIDELFMEDWWDCNSAMRVEQVESVLLNAINPR